MLSTESSNLFSTLQHIGNYGTLARPYLPYAVAPLCFYGVYKFLSYLIPGPHHQKRLKLKNRTVFITGASSGLGRALAFEFYSKGAKLILTARSLNKLEELCKELEEVGKLKGWNNPHKPVYRYLDLAELNNGSEDGISQINEIRSLAIDGETIDILVNNAGLSNRGSCLYTSLKVQRQIMEVNFFGPLIITQTLLDAIPSDGAILIIGSLQSRVALPYRSAYSASKHANQAFFDSLRGEERSELQILMVNAGYINTGFGSRALDVDGRPVGRDDENQKAGMSPEVAAQKIVKALKNRETELILAKPAHRLIIWLRILAPNLMWWLLSRRAKKELEKQEQARKND